MPDSAKLDPSTSSTGTLTLIRILTVRVPASFRPKMLTAVLSVGLALASPIVHAQQVEDPVSTARVRLGPLGLTPGIALKNFGVDSNVFNEFDNPRRDFTATLSPDLKAWFRAGRTRTSGSASADLVYFKTYGTERSIDRHADVRFEVPGNHLTPWVLGRFATTRQRAGFEVDARLWRTTTDLELGTAVKLAPKTKALISGSRLGYRFQDDAVFLGSDLSEALNRDTNLLRLELRHSLTTLTTLIARADALTDRFVTAGERDADTVRIQAGFDLAQRALISGKVLVGYATLKGVGGGAPDYKGLIGSLGAGVTVFGRTRVEFTGDREVAYSYDLNYPYFLQTGGLITVTPRLTEVWDIQGRLGAQRMAYANRTGTLGTNRIDHATTEGAGVGYRLGRDLRIGLNFDWQRRTSPLQIREYSGLRIGTSVTYVQR